jgi:hypothetical protein
MSPLRFERTGRIVLLLPTVLAGAWLGLAQGAAAAGCADDPNSRALDFWVGDWTIAAPGGTASAASRITLELDGCVVVERWDGGRGHRGENLFAYSAEEKGWRGLFADNEGRAHIFPEGQAADGSAQFTGPSHGPQGETVLNRVTIRRLGESQVEQLWEKSTDGGKTWTTAFRGAYTKKPS